MKRMIYLTILIPTIFFGQIVDEFKVRYKLRLPGAPSEEEHEFIVKGNMYLEKEFRPGKTFLYGKIEAEKPMRYNAYYDNIEILQPDSTILLLRKNEDIEANIEDIIYRNLDYVDHQNEKSGFFTPLNRSETVLYRRILKTISGPHFPEHGYDLLKPPEFVIESSYYIKRKNKPAEPLLGLSKKEVFAILWSKYSELRKYASANKLSMRTEEEVIQVLEYYDSLKQSENRTNEN